MGFPTLIREAVCNIAPTVLDEQFNAIGWVRFSRAQEAAAMNISYRIEQITAGVHPWCVNVCLLLYFCCCFTADIASRKVLAYFVDGFMGNEFIFFNFAFALKT